ncbi:MAG TPA: hypothetical protein VGI87_05030 [Solirubrobacteraceae bacterium]|jgi:hypothetical protein
MTNGSTQQATAFSTFALDGVRATLWIGGQNHFPNQPPDTAFIWLVVVDLTDLSVAASDVSDGTGLPNAIAGYLGNSQYFLYAISNAAWAQNMPQGALYNALQKVGAGAQLSRLEQIYGTIGTGILGNFSYILAATMTQTDEPGFEALSMDHHTVLTMGFIPITINGQTIYAPVQEGGF